MRVLVDSNVLLRIDQTGNAHQTIAQQAVGALVDRGHELRTLPQVLYEYWVVATRPVDANGLGFSCEDTRRLIDEHGALFPVLRDERGVFDRWCELVARYAVHGKRAHDARLVAAMLRHDVRHVLTFNTGDFARYEEIVIVDPEGVIDGTAKL